MLIFVLGLSFLFESTVIGTRAQMIPNTKENKLATAPVVSVVETQEEVAPLEEEIETVEVIDPVVFEDLTMGQLIDKLNRSLHSTLSGKGQLFAEYSLQLGIDPYLAVAIVLHETGCKWECSYLVKACNNVGGVKGGPGCNGGSYRAYESLDAGITQFLDNLYRNYYAYGLTTPELMNSKYAASTTWAEKVQRYMEEIRLNS